MKKKSLKLRRKRKHQYLAVCVVVLFFVLVFNFDYLSSAVTSFGGGDGGAGEAVEYSYDRPPLLLLHGFNPVYSQRVGEFAMKEYQLALAQDLDYVNVGMFLEESSCEKLKGVLGVPVIRVSYFTQFSLEEIEVYSENLGKVVEEVKKCSGAEEVDVIAHSMGGIVARNYVKLEEGNGGGIGEDGDRDSSIRKLIMLGTPNQGELYYVGGLAKYFVESGESKVGMDFVQLTKEHDFIVELNKGDWWEESGVEQYTVAGLIDERGDGLVVASGVAVDGGVEHKVVSCNHVALRYPPLCEEGYEFVKEVLVE